MNISTVKRLERQEKLKVLLRDNSDWTIEQGLKELMRRTKVSYQTAKRAWLSIRDEFPERDGRKAKQASKE